MAHDWQCQAASKYIGTGALVWWALMEIKKGSLVQFPRNLAKQ